MFGVGLGVTAYTLGVRHAFDADHIAAIDNTTRKLVAEGRPRCPPASGSRLVIPLSCSAWRCCSRPASAPGRTRAGRGLDDAAEPRIVRHPVPALPDSDRADEPVRRRGIAKVFRPMRNGDADEAELEQQLQNRGVTGPGVSRATRRVNQPWHLYPVGPAVGSGFRHRDEVGLLVLAGGAAAFSCRGTPSSPSRAVRRRHVPARRAGRHLHGTGIRLGVPSAGAQGVLQPDRDRPVGDRGPCHRRHRAGGSDRRSAGCQVGSAGRDRLGRPGVVGFAIVGLFVATWLLALLVSRYGRVEEKWAAPVGS